MMADKPADGPRLRAARGYDTGFELAGAFAQDSFRMRKK